MSDQTFADELPASVAARYNLPLLRDSAPAPTPTRERAQARRAVEETIEALRALLDSSGPLP